MLNNYKEHYAMKLIDELANEKFSWNSVLKALQLLSLSEG